MYEDSFGNYPYLVKEPITKVMGELYEIKRKELLDKIDEFEGVPEYYQRKKIKVKTHKGVNFAKPIILIFQYENEITLNITPKRVSKADRSKLVAEDSHFTINYK